MALCTPDWLLERIALGELPPESLVAARARLEQEPDGRARLARLEEDSQRTLSRHSAEAVASEVRRREHLARVRGDAARPSERPDWQGLALGMPVVASLVLLFLSAPRDSVEPPLLSPARVELLETPGIKGDARLLVYRQGMGLGDPELLMDHAQAHAGDLLQLSYVSGGKTHGVVVSVDGRGAVTLHFPTTLVGSTALKPGRAVSLAHSYELDDAPDFERFFLVTSQGPLDAGAVLEAARLLARQPVEAGTHPLPLPDTLAQTSFTLEKVP
ncbi:ActD protein [Myxococcus sp. K15C18031901]|uniref:ActD protein n=1 Tax=Myxococcus dinghuensis TaxID=2906761 RepID=UPI0020A71D86|nr:ActD protein [Myxococcus dinghuensis]MCP3103355.1 ActD protein [Myxococcus dinghuensis]